MRNQDANRPQRIKIIIITIIAAGIIFIFGAWLITSAIKSVEKKQQASSEQNTTTQKDEKTADNKAAEQSNSSNSKTTGSSSVSTNTGASSNKPGINTTSPASQYPVNQQNNTSNTSTTDLPTTGPEDLLPTALLIGIASYLFFKNREIKAKLALQNS